METNQDQFMKNKFFLLALTSLSLISVHAGTAPTHLDPGVIELPTFVVESPRYLPAEKSIEDSLTEFRSRAQAPDAIFAELPALRGELLSVSGRSEQKAAQKTPIVPLVAKS